MDASLTFTLAPQQVLHVALTEPDGQITHLLPTPTALASKATPAAEPAFDQLLAKARAEIEQRTYHMGRMATAGLDYDDRLATRLKCSESTAYKYLGLPEHRGGIRHRRVGKKYHITERAVREWEGDKWTLTT